MEERVSSFNLYTGEWRHINHMVSLGQGGRYYQKAVGTWVHYVWSLSGATWPLDSVLGWWDHSTCTGGDVLVTPLSSKADTWCFLQHLLESLSGPSKKRVTLYRTVFLLWGGCWEYCSPWDGWGLVMTWLCYERFELGWIPCGASTRGARWAAAGPGITAWKQDGWQQGWYGLFFLEQ